MTSAAIGPAAQRRRARRSRVAERAAHGARATAGEHREQQHGAHHAQLGERLQRQRVGVLGDLVDGPVSAASRPPSRRRRRRAAARCRTPAAPPASSRSGCSGASSGAWRRRRAADAPLLSLAPTTIASARPAQISPSAISRRPAREARARGRRARRQQPRDCTAPRRARSRPAAPARSRPGAPGSDRLRSATVTPVNGAAASEARRPRRRRRSSARSCSRRGASTTSATRPATHANSAPREKLDVQPHRRAARRRRRQRAAATAGRCRSPASAGAQHEAERGQLAHRVPVGQRLLEPTLGADRAREVQQPRAAAARRSRSRSRSAAPAASAGSTAAGRAAAAQQHRRGQQHAGVEHARSGRRGRRCRRSAPR